MKNSDFLDFDDILSHDNEKLSIGDFDLIEVKSVTETDITALVYDLTVEDNKNYIVDALGLVHNGGKRAGAGTVALPIWHNDILDFLDMQTEHGDPRLKAFDVFPQVTVPDIFMERDKANLPWVSFCPFEVKTKLGIDVRGLYGDAFTAAYLQIEQAFEDGKLRVSRKFNSARELTKIIMRAQFETGLPYIAFTDTINEHNPNKYDTESYGITSVNLCVESYSNVKPDVYGHVCNLCSINLGNIDSFEELAEVSRYSARMLDRGIDLTNNPNDITAAHNKRYRTIGIGQMGLHDYLAKNFKTFKSLDIIREISECIEYNAAIESTKLAKEHGSFEAYDISAWKTGEMVAKFKKHASGKYDWDFLQALINQYGMRNSQLTSPAPTTSTAIYQDASASVLPVYDAFFTDDNSSGSLITTARYLDINPLCYGKNFAKHTAIEIIDAVSESQKFIDTGVSMELIFDQNRPDFTAKDLYDAIHYAHSKGIKAIYYIRSIKKNATLEAREVACESCAA